MAFRTVLLTLALATTALAGCLNADDEADPNALPDLGTGPARDVVHYALPDVIAGLETVEHIQDEGGQGLWTHNGIAMVSAGGAGFFTVDIRDPKNPIKLGELRDVSARDVDVIDTGAQVIAVLAQGGPHMFFVDVTDPTQPTLLADLDVGASVHNLAVLPGTSLVFNARSLGDAVEPGIDIIDATDPTAPVVAKVWDFPRMGPLSPVATTGCHDITLFPDVARGYCAGVTQTYVLDITDPMEPKVISTISNPLINIHHYALPDQDHTILMIGDEYGGAAAPACFGSADIGPANPSTPTGAVWFYDISDPTMPMLLSWLSPPIPQDNAPLPCTAHFGELIEDRPLLAIGWYNAGVVLVDFANPMTPKIVDIHGEAGSNVWDAQYWNGHLFTGEIGQGMGVLSFV